MGALQQPHVRRKHMQVPRDDTLPPAVVPLLVAAAGEDDMVVGDQRRRRHLPRPPSQVPPRDIPVHAKLNRFVYNRLV